LNFDRVQRKKRTRPKEGNIFLEVGKRMEEECSKKIKGLTRPSNPINHAWVTAKRDKTQGRGNG